MILYSFFIISNGFDKNFVLMTRMKDWRLKFSSMKSLYKKYHDTHKVTCHTLENENGNLYIYKHFWFEGLASNYTCYLIEKREFETIAEAETHRMYLQNNYDSKAKPRPNEFVIKFIH